MAAYLPNTHFPRSRNSGLPAQSSPPSAQQPQRGVWQDKPHPSHERIASIQPGSVKKAMRSQQMSNNTPRSQKRSTPNRRTTQLIVWVHPLVKAEIQRTAEREGLSVSKVGAAFLEKAIQQDIHTQYDILLKPMLRQIIRDELRTFGNRIVFFLMRIAFASEQARILVTNILDRILRREGVTSDTFSSLVDQSNKMARRNILHKTPQLQSLLEEWEGSVQDEGEKNKMNTDAWQL